MRLVQTRGDHLKELLEIERFQDRVADRLRRDFLHPAFSGCCKDDDVRPAPRIQPVDPIEELVAVHTRHHEVEQDQVVRAVLRQFFEPGGPILGELDRKLHLLQDSLKQDADGHIIINHQYLPAAAVDSADHLSIFHIANFVPA